MNVLSGVKFFRNHLINRVPGSLRRPTYAYITVTAVCNSRCRYCDMWKNTPERELDTPAWKRIIDELVKLGVVTLTFSGGEPFIRRDLFELARYAKSRGLITMVVTNLSLFRADHCEKIAESFDFFGISLDSTKPGIYQEIRGRDWLGLVQENVRTLMAGLRALKADVHVCGMVTISNKNADEMHEILHLIFDDLGMDTVSFNVLDPNGSETAQELAPSPGQTAYIKTVISDHKSSYPISNSARFLDQLGHFDYHCNPWKCVQVNEKGFLLSPCLFSALRPDLFPDGKKTDLCNNKLSDVWRNEQKNYSRYADCNVCNLGCVAESAWSTYDLPFVIRDSFFGMILPTMKRIGERNSGGSCP